MISRKVIKVVKENTFNQAWTLFDTYDMPISKNHLFKKYELSDIVEFLVSANEVNLMISNMNLFEELFVELDKFKDVIKLNVIAKDEKIVSRCNELNISDVTINDSFDFNYIAIIGEEKKCFILKEQFIETSDIANRIYFDNENIVTSYNFLSQVARIVIIDKAGNKYYSKLIEEAQKENVECIYVVDSKNYSKEIFNYALVKNIKLVCSDVIREGVVVQYKNTILSELYVLGENKFFTSQTESIDDYISNNYRCLFCDDNVEYTDLFDKAYCISNGTVELFNIVDTKVLFYDVKTESISDFISEKFDMSIIDNHNNYSNKAYKIEYQFNLIPPIMDNSYEVSSIYEDIHNLINNWNELQTLNIEGLKKDYYEILNDDVGLIEFFDETINFTESLNKFISEANYSGYYKLLNNAKALYENYKSSLILRCKEMYSLVNEEVHDSKLDKFDNEIAGYRETISEKINLISEGIDVISNRRSVEILEKKIEDLLRLKASFENSDSNKDDKGLEIFIDKCNEILANDKKIQSLSDIVRVKDVSKMAKLKSFVDNYLYAVNVYIKECLNVIDRLREANIPEEYTVYEKNGERYIVIDDLFEYYDTKKIREDFNLKCIARR